MATNQVTDTDITDAIRATDVEIFDAAFSTETAADADAATDPASEDDRSPEEMGDGLEGQHEDDGAEEGAEGSDDDADDAGEKDQPRADDGTFTAKKPETEEVDPKVVKPDAQATEPKPGARVPSFRVREANERAVAAEAQAAEAKAAAEKSATDLAAERQRYSDEIKALNERLDRVLVARQQPATKAEPKPEPAAEPDLFLDPDAWKAKVKADAEGAARSIVQQGREEFEALRLETSFAAADRTAPNEFKPAYEALSGLKPDVPEHRAIVQRVLKSADPAGALLEWHRGETARREIGNDLPGYKAKLVQETRETLMKDPEFRQQILESLRAEAEGGGNNGRPANVITRIPRSLSTTPGRRGEIDAPEDGSEKAIFDSAFQQTG